MGGGLVLTRRFEAALTNLCIVLIAALLIYVSIAAIAEVSLMLIEFLEEHLSTIWSEFQ